MDVCDEDLSQLYTWVDEIPLSRPKRNIARDFADGVLLAEVVAHYFPKLVELHNYSAANGLQQKLYNLNTLNQRVLRKLSMQLTKQHMADIANGTPGAVERALKLLRLKLAGATEESIAAATAAAAGFGAPAGGGGSPHTGVIRAAAAAAAAAPPRGSSIAPGVLQGEAYWQQAASSGISSSSISPKLGAGGIGSSGAVSAEVLVDKERTIGELWETNEILEAKVRKLEQLVKLKDTKINTLLAKLQAAGLA